jgi:uncharacterized membrane protein YuzA (DUF378 family)
MGYNMMSGWMGQLSAIVWLIVGILLIYVSILFFKIDRSRFV